MKNKNSKMNRRGRRKTTNENSLATASNVTIALRINPPDDPESFSNRIFPCRPNEEVREALEKVLHPPVRIEVAGGIVRHGW